MSGPFVLLAEDRVPRPWKNGGGVTKDIACFPRESDLESFDWRLSVADMSASGGFSSFPGIDRHLIVLSGRLRMTLADGTERILEEGDAAMVFAGDPPSHGSILGGSIRNLNLMVRRTACSGRLRHLAPGEGVCTATTTILVARERATLEVEGDRIAVADLDAVVLRRGQRFRSDARLICAEIGNFGRDVGCSAPEDGAL